MDNIEFVKNIPAEQLARIFKDFFEQHMVAYDLLKGVQFYSLNSVDINTASIMYSVKLMDTANKEKLVEHLSSRCGSLTMYGKTYSPEIFLNGDILCITIKK